jgi:hypothetical protein
MSALPRDTRPGLHPDTMAPVSQSLADQFTAFVAEFKASRPQVEQPTRREVMGPFKPTYAPGISWGKGCIRCGDVSIPCGCGVVR